MASEGAADFGRSAGIIHVAHPDRNRRSRVCSLANGSEAMNVANLQLEGLLMAVASINQVLVRKGVLSVEEIDIALRKAEASETSEERSEGMSASSRDAVNFPIRLLELANQCQPEADMPSFSKLARMVGQIMEPYNDQM
jgi:hypothetical protein